MMLVFPIIILSIFMIAGLAHVIFAGKIMTLISKWIWPRLNNMFRRFNLLPLEQDNPETQKKKIIAGTILLRVYGVLLAALSGYALYMILTHYFIESL